MKKYIREQKGITLIALVITIIVLLIIASIAINGILGENGILKQASTSKNKTEYTSAYEAIRLKIMEVNTDTLTNQGRKATLYEIAQYLSQDTETQVLVKQYNATAKVDGAGVIPQESELTNFTVQAKNYEEYTFLIGQTCTIEKVSIDNGVLFANINSFDSSLGTNQTTAVYDNWKQLLQIAGINSSSYSSFEDALNNTAALQQIINSANAIDYLIQSTNTLMNQFINNSSAVTAIASNTNDVKKVLANDTWMAAINTSSNANTFISNINTGTGETATEVLIPSTTTVEYYKYDVKAGKKYFLECYGAAGGSFNATYHGGYGGYTYGTYSSAQDQTIYIYVGGAGTGGIAGSAYTGGYNGGGSINSWGDGNERRATGGGATHVSTQTGLLTTLETNKASIIMVAGGGGGAQCNIVGANYTSGIGGNGGGLNGSNAYKTSGGTAELLNTGATQLVGGTTSGSGTNGLFGQGGSGTNGNGGRRWLLWR